MNLMRLGVLCVCALFGPLLSDLTDLARAATLEDAGGGALTAPVVQGNYFYIGTGTTLAVWDMTDPLHPALAGRTRSAPAPGPIRALTKVGGYLYAGWNSSSGIGGLIVYSLADPAHPAVAATIDRYVDADYRDPHGLAVSGHYVLVGDNANGLVVLDATDPLQPSFVTQDFNVTAFDSMTLSGSQLFAYGNSFIGTVIGAYDVSDPAAPVYESQLGLSLDDGVFRALLTDGYAIGIGTSFVVYDLADPMDIKSIASVPMDPATNAVRAGNTVYVFGATGIQVWDFSTPASPALVRTVDVGDAVFNTDQTASTPFGPMVLTHTDRAFLIGTADPQNPTLAASLTIPFGVGAYSAGFDAGHVYFAEDSYGLAAADRATNAPIGRLDVALDPIPAARAFEDVSVDGGRAYLASWGFGVIIADLSDPAHPSELGRFEFPFVGTIQARGNRVYAGSGTNGGIFAILDVSDPADPQLLGGINTDKTMSLVVRGDLAFLADEDAFGTGGGLRIVDVSDPTAPIVTALDSTDCNYAGGIDASADGRIVYLACEDGTLKIFDASDKSNPALIGSVFLPGSPNLPDYNVAHAVAVDGGTAFVGTESGVDEVDVSDPHAPTVKAHHETGTAVYRVVRADDSRIYAFAGQAGTFVFSNDKIFASGFEAAP